MMFNFEYGFDCIHEALEQVKATIFRIPQDPLDLIQPDWTTQLSLTLECYNVTIEEEDEDPFIHKFLEVYFDDWTMFELAKCHVASLHLMLDTCRRYQIVLNLKKCLFCVPFGTLLGHVVC